MTTKLRAAKEDIAMSAEIFADEILRLPAMTDSKRRLVAVGRALNTDVLPTRNQRTYFYLAWNVFRKLLGADYRMEVERIEQLYQMTEIEYRDEIARAMARRWDGRKWYRRR